MLKKMLAAPLLGLLFVVFMPIAGVALFVSAFSEVFYKGIVEVAGYLENWAGFSNSS